MISSPTITFASGSSDGTSACTNVDIIDDDNFEGDHSFDITLDGTTVAPASCASVGMPDTATVTITDNDGNTGIASWGSCIT